MDQKTPHDSAVLHLLPPVAGHLTLEYVDLRGVVLSVTAMNRFPLWGISETGSDDRVWRLPDKAQNAARMWRCSWCAGGASWVCRCRLANQVCTVVCCMKASAVSIRALTSAQKVYISP